MIRVLATVALLATGITPLPEVDTYVHPEFGVVVDCETSTFAITANQDSPDVEGSVAKLWEDGVLVFDALVEPTVGIVRFNPDAKTLRLVVDWRETHDTLYDGPSGCEPACQEDEPCWDCSTMGNRVCGGPAPSLPVSPAPTPPVPVTEAAPAIPVPATPQLTG